MASWRGATPQGDEPNQEPLPRWGAFGYANFRRFWLASVVRVSALQFRIIGIPWLVKVELGLSATAVGFVALSAALPTILLNLPAG